MFLQRVRLFRRFLSSHPLQLIRHFTKRIRQRSSILHSHGIQRRIRILRSRTSIITTRAMTITFQRINTVSRRCTFHKNHRSQSRQRRHNLTHSKQSNSNVRLTNLRVITSILRRALTTFNMNMTSVIRTRYKQVNPLQLYTINFSNFFYSYHVNNVHKVHYRKESFPKGAYS